MGGLRFTGKEKVNDTFEWLMKEIERSDFPYHPALLSRIDTQQSCLFY